MLEQQTTMQVWPTVQLDKRNLSTKQRKLLITILKHSSHIININSSSTPNINAELLGNV